MAQPRIRADRPCQECQTTMTNPWPNQKYCADCSPIVEEERVRKTINRGRWEKGQVRRGMYDEKFDDDQWAAKKP